MEFLLQSRFLPTGKRWPVWVTVNIRGFGTWRQVLTGENCQLECDPQAILHSCLCLTSRSLPFRPDGKTIAVVGYAGQKNPIPGKPSGPIQAIKLFDTRTSSLLWEHPGIGNDLSEVAFSTDGETLAFAEGPLTLLELRTGNLRKTLKPVSGTILAVAYSPDGRTLAGAGSHRVSQGGFGGEGRVTLWDLSTATILQTLNGPTGRAQTVTFSPDSRSVAAGGTGPPTPFRSFASTSTSEVRLFDVATGRMTWTAEGASEAATSLAFAPDGKSLGFCDSEHVYLLNASNGKLMNVLMETTRRHQVRDRPPAKTGR